MCLRNEEEADAILGLLLLKYDGKIEKKRECTYKFKSSLQVSMLKKVFKITQYPCTNTRMSLAILLNMQPRSIQIWFQNTRQAIKDGVYTASNNSTVLSQTSDNEQQKENESKSKQKYLKKKIMNGQYQSYEISSLKLLQIYLKLKQKGIAEDK